MQKTLKSLLQTDDSKALLGSLERIATALEVMAGLKARVQSSEDESEVMYGTDEDYARMQQEELEKGRPEEED